MSETIVASEGRGDSFAGKKHPLINKCVKYTLVLSLVFFSTACVSTNKQERVVLKELKSYGIPSDSEKVKDPALAGALNVLPGFGNFYLAYGSDESAQWPIGMVNLLLWPISVVWGVPMAAVDANTMNKKETAYYYQYDKNGKVEMEKLRRQAL